MIHELNYRASTGPAFCVAVYTTDKRRIMLVEPDSNPGMSVTNAIERVVAAMTTAILGPRAMPEDATWLEAYESRIRRHGSDPYLSVVTWNPMGAGFYWTQPSREDAEVAAVLSREFLARYR